MHNISMRYTHTLKVLEQCQIAPPTGSVPQTSLRLTFFDLAELDIDPPLRCLYFYRLQCSKTHFMQSILPGMKRSLSVTLQHFFPFAGYLSWSPQSVMPEIIYCDGDSVSFTVAESNFSFNHICGNHLRDTNEFAPLATHLVPRSSTTAAVQYPLLALRVTLFPDSGICVGQTFNHVAADGMSATHFMKFWASVCSNLGGEAKGLLSHSLPSFDRTTIIDPHGIEKAYLNYLKKIKITQHSFILPTIPTDPVHDKVVATFIMDSQSIEKLKKWILKRTIKINPYFILTSVGVTCAYVWVCLIKALESVNVRGNSREHILIPVDSRTRLVPALPVTYFGNCLISCVTTINKNVLVGEDGIVIAAEMIGKAIQTTCNKVLDGAEKLLDNFSSLASERLIAISGSPKLGLYDVNFGWGKPKKFEIMSAYDDYGLITLAEFGGNADRGLEISVTLKNLEMDAFASLFHDTLNNLLKGSSAMPLLSKL
ncbi:hypothetical protein GIB67_026141 [Kingdonia uniflora]|uniref:Uncharacterized protein n=1 Tax=Kingdonia uniflora TaxID=39325 RepID=A0A7J7M326_9MAGN|nr:hypothetical protein GIB67_026141 [Kingdonia uniflora]